MVYKGADYSTNFYLESHTIDDQGRVMEGKPLLQETIQSMVSVFFEENKERQRFTGMFPENLLQFQELPGGKYKMVWYQPAQKKVLHFAKELKLPSEETWVPAIIYATDSRNLDVFALKSNARPTDKTKIYRAPFYNLNENGDVCLGNAKVKKPTDRTYQSIMKYWEDLFWLSEFTHVNGSKAVKTDIAKVWKQLLTSKCTIKWSDIDELVPSKKTIKDIIK